MLCLMQRTACLATAAVGCCRAEVEGAAVWPVACNMLSRMHLSPPVQLREVDMYNTVDEVQKVH